MEQLILSEELRRLVAEPEDHALFQEVDDGIVLLNMKNGMYFELNHVGSTVWKLLEKHKRLDAVMDLMLERYDVTEDDLSTDVAAFIEALQSNELVRVHEID